MKKFLCLLLFLTSFSFVMMAQSSEKGTNAKIDEAILSKLSYENVPILKLLEGKEGYVVIYQKNRTGVGSTVIPKAWAKGNVENPRKLKFRKTRTVNQAYLTIIKKDGQFSRVIINTPMNKASGIWGVVDYHTKLDGADKETLEELDL